MAKKQTGQTREKTNSSLVIITLCLTVFTLIMAIVGFMHLKQVQHDIDKDLVNEQAQRIEKDARLSDCSRYNIVPCPLYDDAYWSSSAYLDLKKSE